MVRNVRNFGYDNLRFFLISCVVVAHFLEILDGQSNSEEKQFLYFLIYSFHMPAFLFLTGYFAKFSWKTLLRYILLYVVFQTLYKLFAHHVLGYGLDLQYHTPYWLLWFLLTLIFYEMLLLGLARVPRKWMLPVAGLALCLSLLAGCDNGIGYKYSLSRTLVFLPFFVAGHFAGRYRECILRFFRSRKHLWIILLAVALVAGTCMYASGVVTKNMLYGSYSYAIGYHMGIRLVILLVGVLWIAALLALFLSNLNFRILMISVIGQNTLPVFLLHGFVVRYVGKFNLLQGHVGLLILYSAAVLVLFGNPWLGSLFTGRKTISKP